MVAFTQEHAIGAQALVDEPPVLDEDVVQSDDLVEGELVLPRLQDGAPPSLETAARRMTGQ
jgi:hypothetical protein